MSDMPSVKHKQLTALLLEEVLPPGCVIEGIDFTADAHDDISDDATSLPTFLQHYEDYANSVIQEKLKVLEEVKREVDNAVKHHS